MHLHGSNNDNSQRLLSNAALSATGLNAFLEFATEIEAINRTNAESLMSEHEKILKGILQKTLVGMNELSPVDIFISEIQELLKIGQVKILDHYAENQTNQGIPVIGYYKDNRKFICLLPKIATDVVRKNSHSGEEKTLDFFTASISRQLLAKGYIGKPGGGRNLTARVRIPGKGGKSFLARGWKIHASLLETRE
jgi:hypothetical protein